ncbi:MAG TPA: hypothetical protein VGM90_15175 [Kofleriaceae bacterium]|jgi:hypothetical protein
MAHAFVVAIAVCVVGCSKAETKAKPDTHAMDKRAVAPLAPSKQPPRTQPAQLTHVTLKALGMYCEESCPMRVRMALADIPAVYELGFDTSNESIFVSFDSSLGTPKDVTKPMLAAIKSSGFDPWLAKELWPAEAQALVAVVEQLPKGP